MTEIQFARFGNRGGEHTLLYETGADAAALKDAVWRTDAPQQGDIDTLGAFTTGYPLGKFYVAQHTRPDRSAPRPGMVSTTAAFVPVPALAGLELGLLLRYLENTPGELRAMPASAFTDPDRTEPHTHPPGAAALASALLANRRSVWTGEGFSDAIACVWRHLLAEDRELLTFGAAFHPEVVAVPVRDGGLLVLAVPAAIMARFAGWPIVTATAAPGSDPAGTAFLGDGGPEVVELAEILLGDAVRLDQWRHLVAVANLKQGLDHLDHLQLRSLLQLLGLLASAPADGEGLKREALRRLETKTPAAPFADVRGLRGLPWAALPPPGLDTFLRSWAEAAAADTSRVDDMAAAVAEVTTQPRDPFRTQLDAAIRSAVRRATTHEALAAQLLTAGRDAIDWLITTIGAEQLDDVLSDAVAVRPAVDDWITDLARRRQLPRTHAAAIDVTDPIVAWRSQLGVGTQPDTVELLVRRTGPVGTMRAALAIDDATLTDLAASAVSEDPALLEPVQLDDARYRTVWAAAVAKGCDPWAVVRPQDAADALLDELLAGEPVDTVLLDAIARSAAANIIEYPRRQQVWPLLPDETRTRMLAATADALARIMQPDDPLPEPPLAAAVLESALLGAIAHDDAAQAVRLIRRLPGAGPEHAVLVARRGRFAGAAAEDLGQLIVERRWKRAAESIVDLTGRRPDLRPTASRVSNLFSVLERFRRYAGISDGVRGLATEGEVRDALHDVAADLYPAGPGDHALWERSGGSPADCPDARDGRHRWGLALAAIDSGRSGAPTLSDLLRVMLEDYPRNRDLAALAAAVGREARA